MSFVLKFQNRSFDIRKRKTWLFCVDNVVGNICGQIVEKLPKWQKLFTPNNSKIKRLKIFKDEQKNQNLIQYL